MMTPPEKNAPWGKHPEPTRRAPPERKPLSEPLKTLLLLLEILSVPATFVLLLYMLKLIPEIAPAFLDPGDWAFLVVPFAVLYVLGYLSALAFSLWLTVRLWQSACSRPSRRIGRAADRQGHAHPWPEQPQASPHEKTGPRIRDPVRNPAAGD